MPAAYATLMLMAPPDTLSLSALLTPLMMPCYATPLCLLALYYHAASPRHYLIADYFHYRLSPCLPPLTFR